MHDFVSSGWLLAPSSRRRLPPALPTARRTSWLLRDAATTLRSGPTRGRRQRVLRRRAPASTTAPSAKDPDAEDGVRRLRGDRGRTVVVVPHRTSHVGRRSIAVADATDIPGEIKVAPNQDRQPVAITDAQRLQSRPRAGERGPHDALNFAGDVRPPPPRLPLSPYSRASSSSGPTLRSPPTTGPA